VKRSKLPILFQVLIFSFPWALRRKLLSSILGWRIDPTARVGFSIILARTVIIGYHSKIGHLNYVSRLDLLQLGTLSSIGHLNLVYTFPSSDKSEFSDERDRRTHLIIGEHSHLTNLHIVDCTDQVSIGRFTVIAGFRSNILTHSPNFENGAQRVSSVEIGDFCFIGTNSTLLAGTKINSKTIVAAGSIVTNDSANFCGIVGGVPAKVLKEAPNNLGYFNEKIRRSIDTRYIAGLNHGK